MARGKGKDRVKRTQRSRRRRRRQTEILRYFGKMIDAVDALPPHEKAEFMKWDQNRSEGQATSDWPGFVALIGPSPWSHLETEDRMEAVHE